MTRHERDAKQGGVGRTYVLDHNHFESSLATLRGTPPGEIRPHGTSIFRGHPFRHYYYLGSDPRRAISQEKRVSNVLPSGGMVESEKYLLSAAAEGGKSTRLNLN